MPPRRRARRTPTTPAARATDTSSARAGATHAPAQRADPRTLLFDFARGLHATHLVAFGQETGAFQQIGNAGVHGLSVPELAERAGWFPDYARFFLETAYALGILDLASEAGVTPRARYRLASGMADLLADPLGADFMGALAEYHVLVAQDHRRRADLFRTGKAYPYALHGENFLRVAATATRWLPGWFLARVLPRLPALRDRLHAGAHVLDVGCGAGWALVRLAEEFPKSRIIGVDAEPNAIEMAKSAIAFRQLGTRAEARLVAGEELDYEAEFDVVTLFLVLHTIPPRQRAAALAHAARALKRDGLLLILDEAYPETAQEFREPARQRNVVTQWFEGVWGHRLITPSQHRALVDEAGLQTVAELDEGPYHVVMAQRR